MPHSCSAFSGLQRALFQISQGSRQGVLPLNCVSLSLNVIFGSGYLNKIFNFSLSHLDIVTGTLIAFS